MGYGKCGNLPYKKVETSFPNSNLHAKSGKWPIQNAIIQNCPLPWELLRRVGILLSVYQIYLCGHSDRHQVMDQKSLFFICPRVSARFLHCFCTVSRDAMGTLTCKIRQRAQKLQREKSRCFAQKRRKLESSKIRVPRLRGSFNQRARDSSSLEHTKIPRRIVRFLVGFSFFWMLAHLCTLLHTGGKAVFFPCIVCILCIVSRACRGEAPPSRLRRDRSVA